jgi:peptide/nickel transport system permease protein
VVIFAVLGFSLPVFWLGFLLIYAVAMQLPMLPVQGDVNLSQGLLPFLKHLILPALTLGLIYLSAWSLDW